GGPTLARRHDKVNSIEGNASIATGYRTGELGACREQPAADLQRVRRQCAGGTAVSPLAVRRCAGPNPPPGANPGAAPPACARTAPAAAPVPRQAAPDRARAWRAGG